MLGGVQTSTTLVLNDNREFDGSDWQQDFPTTSLSARALCGMAYDERRRRRPWWTPTTASR